ncbi:MAG: dihydroorotate dehydrogenase electron transfer subunit [Candidatus Thorarchaeota archaeon]
MDVEKMFGRPVVVPVKRKIQENPNCATLIFDTPDRTYGAGQFLMVMVPGAGDEVPMSVSLIRYPEAAITVQSVGDTTEALISVEEGDLLGLRGPFGRGFEIRGHHVLVVGGGIGSAPLRPLLYNLMERQADVVFVNGARSRERLLYVDEFSVVSGSLRMSVSTDDGSAGTRGLVTDVVRHLLHNTTFDAAYACGPEAMLTTLYAILAQYRIPFQFSLERFMKCGCGLCGTCALDPDGLLVCMDGPVFSGETISKIEEFGRYRRNGSGVREPL